MPAGRPTVMTPKTVRNLEEAFSWGCSDTEACVYADISTTSLYKYAADNEEFAERKETLKNNPVMKARKIVMDSLDNDDLATANRVIDRKEGSKVAVTGPEGGALQIQEVKRTIVDPDDPNS